MTKFLSTLALTVATLTNSTAKTPATAPDVSGIYARSAAVVSLDYGADIVTLEDSQGFLWEFYGCEDWNPGEIASVLMWDNGTPETIFDDVILQVRYSGYITADFQ